MKRGDYIYAIPFTYIDHIPDSWFKHFNNGKKSAIRTFSEFDYITIYLTKDGEFLVYFRELDFIKHNNITVYEEPTQIKELLFNTLLEYS